MISRTVGVDFDGVIHRYSKGWQDGSAYDVPMPGAEKALLELMRRYYVYIFTTRDPEQVKQWFADNMPMIPVEAVDPSAVMWQKQNVLGVSKHKLVAFLWIDDRVLRFDGDWSYTLEQVYQEAGQ